MADLSKIRLNGTLYNFKDAEARAALANIHDPENDSDVEAMLLSYGLTVAAETNGIISTAITGKAKIQ